MVKFKSLDEARIAFMNGKITSGEFTAMIKKNALADETRKEINKESKRIERKLQVV
ncbi:hypothetical protein [Alkalicoccobacillus gibsonii]|uniref:hypothetical protein n=1 Tax=Alkalicoccobacillus gibsonii TaxID=79881 RepID=UPI0035136576